MPLKQFERTSAKASDVNGNSGTFKKAAIFKIDSTGKIQQNEAGVFLLNPSTIEENKTANWAMQSTPGSSDPILQWISSGPRTLSFDALVTADTSLFDSSATIVPGQESNTQSVINKVANLAASFFNVSSPIAPTEAEITDKAGDSLDITNILNYYRSLLYPVYDDVNNPRVLNQSPPLLVLYFGKSVIKLAYQNNGRISNNHDLWVLTGLNIKTTKQLPNLAPMEAIVRFTLTQYTIKSFDSRRFYR